jgi:transformation/transcription domain-associated protein
MAPSAAPEGGAVLSGSMNWEPVRKRLLGPDLKDALLAATELREGIEIVHTVEFPLMLSALLPAFSTILAHRTSPSPDTTTIEHKLRNVVLEIISRMPSNEILRPHAPHLVAVALDILNRDYEENALLASRIVFDLYKVYRSLPQDYVQPYLDFVQNAYRALPTSVQRNFLFPALAAGPPPDSQLKSGSAAFDISALEEKESETDMLTPAKGSSTPIDTAATGAPAMTSPSSSLTSPSMAKIPASPVPRLSPRSNSSFRVLTECPLIVMLMFQLYPKFLRSNIPVLINVMMEALALRAPPLQSIKQGNQPLDSNAKRLYFSRSRELVAAQAKTLSFLTYLLRGFSNDLKPYEDRLASNVVALMSTCPREFISTRKELLVATRHLLNSEFRNGFFRHVDALLDERVLMGSHHRYSEQTILRPLGYTTLSDLVHHVRSLLTMPQMSRVVSMFSRVLHDSSMTLPMSTQYTAVRTLLSVVDIVFHNKDRNPQHGRDILVRILKTLVDKLSELQNYRAHIKQHEESESSEETSKEASKEKFKEKFKEEFKEKFKEEFKEEFKEDSLYSDNSGMGHPGIYELELPSGTDQKESFLKDLKSMIRAIIVGHKTLIWFINNYRAQREKEKVENTPPRSGANEEVASALLKITHTEHALLDRYIVLAFPCMKWLKEDDSEKAGGISAISERSSSDQYRDALTYFAAAFTNLDGYDLRRTLGRRLELLVDAVMDEPTAIVVPRHLLAANASTSFEFCSMLLDFLVERMDELVTSKPSDIQFVPPAPDCDCNIVERLKKLSSAANQGSKSDDDTTKRRSSAYLQLFERVLKSLSSYPDNERALRPHLKTIVSTCLRSSMEKNEFKVDNYCMLLRYVFRSISAGKFEESYRELLPLIPTVLNGLFRVFQATDDPVLHHTIIELLLTIPARLSSLLPHMNLLLQVIVRALESNSGDLVNLGYVNEH